MHNGLLRLCVVLNCVTCDASCDIRLRWLSPGCGGRRSARILVNDDGSQVVKLSGVTIISDLVFDDPCAFWVLNCTNPEERACSLVKFAI